MMALITKDILWAKVDSYAQFRGGKFGLVTYQEKQNWAENIIECFCQQLNDPEFLVGTMPEEAKKKVIVTDEERNRNTK